MNYIKIIAYAAAVLGAAAIFGIANMCRKKAIVSAYDKKCKEECGFDSLGQDTDRIILTRTVSIPVDDMIDKNLGNICIIGDEKTGKTRNYGLPNLLQADTNYFCVGGNGQYLYETADYLKSQGYTVKSLNISEMYSSESYNPFRYIYDIYGNCRKKAVMNMVDIIVDGLHTNNFSQPYSRLNSADFAVENKVMRDLLLTLCFYLIETQPKENRNFKTLYDIIERNDSLLDIMRNATAKMWCMHYYSLFLSDLEYHSFSEDEILGTAAQRFVKFKEISSEDDLELEMLYTDKAAFFVSGFENSRNDMNFLAALVCSQAYDILRYNADYVYNGKLPIYTHFILDDFVQIQRMPEFENILSESTERGFFTSVFVQRISQFDEYCKNTDDISKLLKNSNILYMGSSDLSTQDFLFDKDYRHNYVGKIVKMKKYMKSNDYVISFKNIPFFKDKKYEPEIHMNYFKIYDKDMSFEKIVTSGI